MKTKYEMFIDAVSYAMEDHSYNIQWFYDFDKQETVPFIEEAECYPENGHRLLRIEQLESWESFRIMEDFVDMVPEEADQDKLWSALRQRHPFSAFREMLHYTGLREKWFAYHDEQMQCIVERWMEDEGIVYKDGLFSCNSNMVHEFYWEDEDFEDLSVE